MTTSRPSVREHDVVVLGAGPAGCAASILLAHRGHDVAMVCPSRPAGFALAESVPPSARKLLGELGVLSAMEEAGFQANGGNTVWWAGAPPRSESFDSGLMGFHVDRATLEEFMVPQAKRAGATVYEGVSARSARELTHGWEVLCEEPGHPNLRAKWVLDATGRRGLVARGEGRLLDRSTTTVALVRRWRSEGGFGSTPPTHTLVESYRDGWAWSVPLAPDVRCFTAMVDPSHSDLTSGDLNELLDAELSKARHVGSIRAGAEPMGTAWACTASLYSARRFARPGLLLLGDGGSFIDPLSSYGVKKALSSGWLGGVAVHTALVDPEMCETAVDFFDARERSVYRQYRAHSADFFESAAEAYGHDYWVSRARASRAAGGSTTISGEVEENVLDQPAVPAEDCRAALKDIQMREALNAVRGGNVTVVRRPVVAGHRIVLAEHLVSPGAPHGIRYVRNVDLARVVDVAPRYPSVPDGWREYNAESPSVSLPDYLAALATAFAAGLLEHSESASPQPSSPLGSRGIASLTKA